MQEKKPALGRDNNDGFVKHEEEKTLSVESNNESPLKMVNGSIIENIKKIRADERCNPPPEVNVKDRITLQSINICHMYFAFYSKEKLDIHMI